MRDKIVPLDTDLVCYLEPTLVEERGEDSPKRKLVDGENKDCDEILDCILPPREWEENGQRWIQHVSNRWATRTDVAKTTETLETSLREYHARDTGICPTRRAIYSRCFDEILRQVTVNSAERGLLLLKIRDELEMSMDAHRTLYEGNVCVGAADSALSVGHQHVPEARYRIAELEAEKQRIRGDLTESLAKYEMVQRQAGERRAAQRRRHDEDVKFLKRSRHNMKLFLEGIMMLKD